MKRYKFEVIIEEGNDEFWENLKGPGCDEMLDHISECLDGRDPEIKLIE